MKDNINSKEIKMAYTEKELKEAIRKRYGMILVKGAFVERVHKLYDQRFLEGIAPVAILPLDLLLKTKLLPSDFIGYEITGYTKNEMTLRRTKK